MQTPKKPQLNPLLKLVLDLGPLLLFFFANSHYGIFAATATFMVAVLAALAVSYAMTRHLPIMPVVTAIIVVIFGSLTYYFHDETFIKMKPTALYLLFGAALLGGLAFNRPLLPILCKTLVIWSSLMLWMSRENKMTLTTSITATSRDENIGTAPEPPLSTQSRVDNE